MLLSDMVRGKEKGRDSISSHPGSWCEARRGVRTSTLPGRSLYTDTGAGGLENLSWSTYLQYGMKTEYPGHYSDLWGKAEGEKEKSTVSLQLEQLI